MACFIAPATAAIVATAVRKKVPARYHFGRLIAMLWGGTVMLVIDHILSGELVLYPPFLTKGFSNVWPEILTVGSLMTLAAVLVWAATLLIPVKTRETVLQRQ